MMLVPAHEAESPLVRMDGIEKSFGNHRVLAGVDVDLHRGEITALVGPNGAGKTTLIKCLLGLSRADRGRIEVEGRTVDPDGEYRRRIGYMPQNPSFPDNLTGREVIDLLREVRGGEEPGDPSIRRLLGLEGELDKPVRTLSGGTRQKLSAAVAFLFDPTLLVLDEPTAGLDPVSAAAFKDHLRHSKDRGAGILLTSHVMSDLEALCDRVLFLLDGRIRFDGTLDRLRDETGQRALERAISTLISREAA